MTIQLACSAIARVVALVAVLALPAAAQTTYYVDGDHLLASDTNAGTSPSAPWKTIHHATLNVDPGDTVKIKKAVYSQATNGEIFPLVILAAGVRFVGDEAAQADWPRIGGDVTDSTIAGVFECNASTSTDDLLGIVLEKLYFVGEDTANKDAPCAVFLSATDDYTAAVSLQNCVIERSKMNDSSVAEQRPSVLALPEDGTCQLTLDDCTIEVNSDGGIQSAVAPSAGSGDEVNHALTVRDCTFTIDPGAPHLADFAISMVLEAQDGVNAFGEFLVRGNSIDGRELSSPNGFLDGMTFGGIATDGGSVSMPHAQTILDDNLVAGCRRNGVSFVASEDGSSGANIQCWDINRNEIRANGEVGLLLDYGDGTHGTYARYITHSNLLVQNLHGLHIKDFIGGAPPDDGGQVEMVNDTIAGNEGLGIRIDSPDGDPGVLLSVANVILWFNNGGEGQPQWGGTAGWEPDDGPALFVFNDWNGNPLTTNGNVDVDPEFVDWTNGDFHLLKNGSVTSPCIDAGTNSPPIFLGAGREDYEKDDRKIDGDGDSTATVDIGADEYEP